MLGVSFFIQPPEKAFSQDTNESSVIKKDDSAAGAFKEEAPQQTPAAQPSNVRSKVLEIAELNKKIFFSEQMIGLKMSAAKDAESSLNSLYKKREALCEEVKKTCSAGDTAKELGAVKSEILNSKLYGAAGFDSLVEKLKTIKPQSHGSDSASVSLGAGAKDSIMELDSYIKLESSRLENPITFSDELVKFASKPQDAEAGPGSADAAGQSPDGGIDPQYEELALFNPTEMYPAGNDRDISINAPAEIKFDGGRIKKQGGKIDLVVRSANVRQKYNAKPGGSDTGKIDAKWDPARNSLSISHNAPLERGAMYSATVVFEHDMPPGANEKPQNGPTGGSAAASSPGSSGSASGSAAASAASGSVRNKSVNGGIFKTVDMDFSENKVRYKLDWNFETIGYTSVQSGALPDGSTNETKLTDGTGEVSLKDKRETDEAKLQKNGSTGETGLKKVAPAFQEYDDARSLPAIILRMPEGSDVRRKSEVFVVFSTDMNPASVKSDTMLLFTERRKGEFIPVTGEIEMVGRKLYFRPYEELVFGRNYKVCVNNIKSASGINFPLAETYFFKTAPGVTSVKLPHDGNISLGDTFEVTISEDVGDVKIKFVKCDNTREAELEFDICARLVAEEPAGRGGIKNMALDSTGSALKPILNKAREAAADIQSAIAVKSSPDKKMCVTFKPRKPLSKNQAYKIDVYSETRFIDEGIIKFKAK